MSDQDKDFHAVFQVYAKVGHSGGDKLSCDKAKEWLKQAGITGEKFTEEEAEKMFKTVSKGGDYLNEEEFLEFIDKVAKTKDIVKKELMDTIITAGRKITSTVTDVTSNVTGHVKDLLSKSKDFHVVFQVYAKAGTSKDDEISSDKAKEWLKEAGIIDGKMSAEEAEKMFKTVSKGKDNLNEKEFAEFMDKIATEKGLEEKDFVDKIITTGGLITGTVTDLTRNVTGNVKDMISKFK